MTSTTASVISFGCIFGGSLIGIALRSALSDRTLNSEKKDVLRLALGLITTLSALVLGLLISTAKGSYDNKRTQVKQIATNVIFVDRALKVYGPDASGVRKALQGQVAALIAQIEFSGAGSSTVRPSAQTDLSDFYRMVLQLSPRDEGQRTLKAEVLRSSLEIGRIRASTLARESTSIPVPFLVILVFWLTTLFAGFGLFATRDLLTVVALCVCALTVSTAIFLIFDMDQPLTGFMKLSIEPIRNALAVINDTP